MKKITNKKYAQALMEVASGLKGKELTKAVENFLSLLKKNRQLSRAPQIIVQLKEIEKEKKGIISLTLTSARDIEEKTLEAVRKIFGKDAEIKTEIDKDLLGGMIIKTKDLILDGSIKNQLKKLKQKLI